MWEMKSNALVTGQDLGGWPNLGHDTRPPGTLGQGWGLRASWDSYAGASGLGLLCTGGDVMGI